FVRNLSSDRLSGKRRNKAQPLNTGGRLATKQSQQSWKKVDAPDLLLYMDAQWDSRSGHQECYAKRRIVEKDPMRIFAVLRQALAVVGQDSGDGVPGRVFLFDRVHEPAHLLVGVGDFSVVGPVLVFFFERRRRVIGHVRIVQMDP